MGCGPGPTADPNGPYRNPSWWLVDSSVTPAVCGDYESLHVVASSYVDMVAVEILRLVELLLTTVCGFGDEGLELVRLLLLAAGTPRLQPLVID